MRIAVLASGRGSNLRALVEAVDRGACAARVERVVSDRPDAPALRFARERSIQAVEVPLAERQDRAAWDAALAEATGRAAPELVVLAGFGRIVGPAMLARFPHRIINVHPALLPAFPGNSAPADALRAGVRISGCTVHVVDEGVDTGPIIAQAAVPVHPDDDARQLHRRIQEREHELLPAVVDWIARGIVELGPPVRYTLRPEGTDHAIVSPRFAEGPSPPSRGPDLREDEPS